MFNLFGAKTVFTAKDAVEGVAKGTVVVLDVREISEVQGSGTAKGGVHIPLGLLPLKADPKAPDFDTRLGAGKPIAVFCAVGGRAGRAVDCLKSLGYEAHNIGGLSDWASAGGAVQR